MKAYLQTPNITKPNVVYSCAEIEAWQWVRPSGVGSRFACSRASAGPSRSARLARQATRMSAQNPHP